VIAAVLCCGLAGTASAGQDETRQYLETAVNPRSDAPCPAAELYSPLRPDPPGTPTVVGLAIQILDASRFSDVEQTLTADVLVAARWRDSRLADPARGDASADCPVPVDALWMPAIEPENLRSRQAFYEPRMLVDARGTVTLARRLSIEVANALDLHDFPFDRHLFKITIWPTFSRVDELVFHPLNAWVALNRERALPGWTVADPVASVQEQERFGRLGRYSRYDLIIGMTREWGFFAWKLGVPLLLIVLMAYAVYFIPPTGVAQQVAVSMTSMLTLIAYMLALSSSLPRIAYLTKADRLFLGCAMLVFLGLVKAVLTTGWVQREASDVIRRVDRTGRWLFPLALLAIGLIALA
jgi:hypothetical protein